ncbi:hypothetical protein H1C71_015381 [Ictidomys tridecemlineatus]|nr:hypothetical protein H1C71_015381 [Ictidomys tridecemlineatus]
MGVFCLIQAGYLRGWNSLNRSAGQAGDLCSQGSHVLPALHTHPASLPPRLSWGLCGFRATAASVQQNICLLPPLPSVQSLPPVSIWSRVGRGNRGGMVL